MAEVGVELAGGDAQREGSGRDEVHHLLAGHAHPLGGMVREAQVAVNELRERRLGGGVQRAVGGLAALDDAAESELIGGSETRPAGGLVQEHGQAVGLTSAVRGGFDEADLDFAEVGEVGAEEGGEGVGLGGAGGDVVDHVENERGLYI